MPAGHHHDLVLEISDQPLPAVLPDPDTAWSATETSWAAAVPALENCHTPPDAQHSYAVLRGLTSRTGGMVAAATTSLPERAEAGRNYDYRYVWIRDQCYAGQAVAAAGPHPLLDDAVRFITDRVLADGDHLAPAYTSTGDPVPDQHTLDLPGYPGGHNIIGTGSTNNSNSTPSARACCCTPPPPATTAWTPTLARRPDSRRRHRRPLEGTRRRHLGNRQPALDPQPAHLRRRTAGHRPARRRPGRRRLANARRQNRRRHLRHLAAPHRSLATLTRLPRPRRRTPATTAPRGTARRRPPHHHHPGQLPARPDRRRLRLPIPARPTTAGRSRRIVHLLRVPRRAGPAPTTPAYRRNRLVRTHPQCVRTTRAVLRGIRHHRTPTSWQPPPGIRPRPAPEAAARINPPHETDTGPRRHAR